jgi:lysozyme
MKTSQAGLNLIKQFEGFRSESYLCPANVWTVGFGTTKNVKPGMIITESQGEQLLQEDVKTFEITINNSVTVPLKQNQFDALVSFVYNVGPGNFKSSTLLKKLNAGEYSAVPNELLKWNKGGGKVLPGLTKRREAEGNLWSKEY